MITPAATATQADWLDLSASLQYRYEWLQQQYDAGNREDHALMLRSNARADMDLRYLDATVELMDSRIHTVHSDTPINNAMVNPVDVLQAYLQFGANSFSVKLGRFTQDIGSRRFMARNRYRNTINAFDGINARWQVNDDLTLRAFHSFPVERRYRGDPRDNKPKADRSHHNRQFSGLLLEGAHLPLDSSGELYLFALNEDDTGGLQTRNRELYSLGARLLRAATPGRLDHELEVLYQSGSSRRSRAPADIDTLDHSASFLHAELGYQFNTPWHPRLQLSYDYASGDSDPNDDENNGLDSLYGVPRGDFGPTGIYRILVRNNISSPAVRLELKPALRWTLNTELRGAWLAEEADTSPSSGLDSGNPNGSRHLGTQLEIVLRWQAIPKRLRLETGTAYFLGSEALRDRGIEDKIYVYFQTGISF
ncbi:MAG: alginate export family protein [Parahaliea sp.]